MRLAKAVLPLVATASAARVYGAGLTVQTFVSGYTLTSSGNYSPSGVPTSGTLIDITHSQSTSGGIGAAVASSSTTLSVTAGAIAVDFAPPTAGFFIDASSSGTTWGPTVINLTGGNTGTTAPLTQSGDLITLTSTVGTPLVDFRGNAGGITINTGANVGNFDIAPNSTLEFGSGTTLNGTGAITIDGGGTLEILNPQASATFTGGYIVSGSTLNLLNNGSLSVGSHDTTTLSNGTLIFGVSGLLLGSSHPLSLINGGGTINATTGTEYLEDSISGSGGITKIGAGTLFIASTANGQTNTFSGPISVNAGTLEISTGADVQTASSITLNSGTLALPGGTVSFSSTIPSNVGIVVTSATSDIDAGTLTTFTIASPVTGAGPLNKTGTGALVLTGANGYGGGTTINGGSLYVNNTTGSGTGSGSVTVNAATLGGSGTISGAVSLTAPTSVLSAGSTASPYATLSTGSVSLADSSTLNINVNSDAGTFSTLAVSGTLALGTTNGALISVTDVGTVGSGFAIGTPFTVVTATGSVTGTFSGLTSGTVVASNGYLYAYTINDPNGSGGTDNVTLTLEAAPEPASLGLVSFAGLLLLRRRRSTGLIEAKPTM